MDLAEYWMLMKRRDLIFRSPHLRDTAILRPMSIGGSWEEKAFAEDAAGNYGSIWPPRSYSCTFCNREFRSAQALGGHMNVHRRDRARLKQSISPQNEGIHTHEENQTIQSSFCSLDSNCYCHHHKPDLNLNTSTNPIAPSSIFPLPTSRVSTFSSSHEKLVNENQKGLVVHPSWSDYSMSARRPFDHLDGPKIKSEKILSGASIYGDYDCDKIKLTVGLTSPTNGYPPKVEWGSVDERVSSKRPKTISTSLSLLLQPCSLISSCPVQSDIMGVKVSSMDDLDLELRLGDTPKVK